MLPPSMGVALSLPLLRPRPWATAHLPTRLPSTCRRCTTATRVRGTECRRDGRGGRWVGGWVHGWRWESVGEEGMWLVGGGYWLVGWERPAGCRLAELGGLWLPCALF